MSEEAYARAVAKLQASHAKEYAKTQKELDAIINIAKNNKLKQEGAIINKFGIDSSKTDKQIARLDKRDARTRTKFTKDLPALDEKPKKSFLRKIFSKSVLGIIATGVVGATGIALVVGALPALGIFASVGLSVAAAKTKAPKALYSSISSAILLCNPKTKKILTNIDALRKGISGAPTEFAANPKKKVAGSHDEILNVINARKKQTANNIESDDLLGAW